jgi:hypothetical protein
MSKKSIDKWIKKHEKSLRADGWMTVDEFMNRVTPAMREYLLRNQQAEDNLVLHPEDLGSNALSFMEGLYLGLQNFGASPIK